MSSLLIGFRNRDLQALLYATETGSLKQVVRDRRPQPRLRMLRAHGFIQNVPRTHRYHVAQAGRTILIAVPTTARTRVNQLNQFAAKAA